MTSDKFAFGKVSSMQIVGIRSHGSANRVLSRIFGKDVPSNPEDNAMLIVLERFMSDGTDLSKLTPELFQKMVELEVPLAKNPPETPPMAPKLMQLLESSEEARTQVQRLMERARNQGRGPAL